MSYLLIFLASVGWSGHCIGMCGMFPLSLAAPGLRAARLVAHQFFYHAGKTFTYVFLGMVAAWLGLYLERWAWWLGWGAGILLVVIGLNTLGVFRRAKGFSSFLEAMPLCAMLRGFMQQTSALSAFLLGLVNGFLPCPLVYAMMGMAATLHSMPQAMATMAVFGIGTAPGLLAVGLAGGWLKNRASGVWLLRLSGVLTIALGVITVLRGFDFFHATFCTHCLREGG
ncbi:MAG: sulfite exporter TauE/SafE family protein [Verrucomicrobia bacterium]|nr:sulfite exporter TauE/SafE family protein [Verrucomicrobiota bacterium]